ncbi:MAG: metabolite traffic protein EboE [Verrucomicrobiae bacterium]|nr:metabolite traffic protein EboE [Verrucomicrobiae bacterium]
MKLPHGLHLTYCTNVHRGESWAEIFAALRTHTRAVRERVAPGAPFGIGLRLGARAVAELNDPKARREFRCWLDAHQAYVFTLNGFPYGPFHGAPVKEAVYRPDWTAPERVAYTQRLFELLAEWLPPQLEGSVSTLPGSFKGFKTDAAAQQRIRAHLWQCVEHIARLSERTGRRLSLALEPEPLCLLETSAETARFFEQMRDEHPNDPRLTEHLRVCYDTCHFAVEFESPAGARATLGAHGIRLGKIQLSNALRLRPTPEARAALEAFADGVYLHQVVVRRPNGQLVRYGDLPEALRAEAAADVSGCDGVESGPEDGPEWRVHFHVPLHQPPTPLFGNTASHLEAMLDALQADPTLCAHLEIETYTWEVLPPELKTDDVTEQIAGEFDWVLGRLRERGLAPA